MATKKKLQLTFHYIDYVGIVFLELRTKRQLFCDSVGIQQAGHIRADDLHDEVWSNMLWLTLDAVSLYIREHADL